MVIEPNATPSSPSSVTVKVEPIDEALSLLGGETKFVKRLRKSLQCPFADGTECGSSSSATAAATPSTPDTNQAMKSTPDDAQAFLPPSLSAGMQPDLAATLGLDSGDVYTWLYGQLVDRTTVGGSYDHNQVAFANALSAASSAGGPSGAPAMPLIQQQQQGAGLDVDGLAFWGLQNVFNFQGAPNAAPGSYTSQFLQSGPEAHNTISNPSAGAQYANGPSASGAPAADVNALSMTVDNPRSYDFELGEGMAVYGEPGAYSQLGSGDDTIENAWRSIMEDPRFAPIEPNSLFPFSS